MLSKCEGEHGSDHGIRPGRRSVDRGLGRTILRERQPQLGGTSRESGTGASAPRPCRHCCCGCRHRCPCELLCPHRCLRNDEPPGCTGASPHDDDANRHEHDQRLESCKAPDNLPPPFRAQRPALDECGRDHDNGGRYHHLDGSPDHDDRSRDHDIDGRGNDHLDGSRANDDSTAPTTTTTAAATTTTAAAATTTTVATRASTAAPTTTSTTAPVTTTTSPHGPALLEPMKDFAIQPATLTPPVYNSLLSIAQRAGAKVISLDVSWSSYEPNGPAPAGEWTNLDAFVNDALARGLKLRFQLVGFPEWARDPGDPSGPRRPGSPRARPASSPAGRSSSPGS